MIDIHGHRIRRASVGGFLLLVLTVSVRAQAPASSQAPEQRARELVSRMTLEEKLSQVPNHAAAIPRLGVPEYDYWNEGLHGLARAGYATVFPQAIGMAATWDRALIQREGETIASEARLKYGQARDANRPAIYFGLTIWSPNINIFRDPRWGRGQETYGEDPFLTGQLGSAFIRGIQGPDAAHPTAIATPKHFAVHSGPESLRHSFDVPVSPHDLEDTYLPAFRAAIVDAHAGSIMCAYNRIDGQPACASDLLLKHKLRGAWNFQGFVTSDCGAIDDVFKGHAFVADRPSASAVSLKAGMDTACGGTSGEVAAMRTVLERHLATEADLDQALVRLFTARFRLGLFDAPAPTPKPREPNSALELQAAHESIVLLKNDGVLPLAKTVQSVAVVGPNAASLVTLEGNYSGVIVQPSFPADADFSGAGVRRTVVYAQGSSLADNFFVPVPRTMFRTPEGKPGLEATYTDESTPAAAAIHRTDAQINFNWSAASPFSDEMTGPAQAFHVQWKGSIVSPGAGDYRFRLKQAHCYPCGDQEHYSILVDGKSVADVELAPAARHGDTDFTLHFTDKAAHSLVVDFAHHAKLSGASITLAWIPPAQPLLEQAVAAAKASDVVVAYVGLSAELEGEEMKVDVPGFGGGDRTSLDLPAAQQALLDAVAATGKPLVVVLMNGSALGLDWARVHANAIVEAWYPGARGGQAIADVLRGAYNPAGRLPVTFYASVAALPAFTDYSMANRTYRYFRGEPTYGFGFGLSYSSFAYSNLRLSHAALKAGEALTATVQVANVGGVEGDEVVEAYLTPPASPTNPRLLLAGFQRVHLAAGEKRDVVLTMDARTLSLVDAEGHRAVTPGTYGLTVAGGQPGASSAKVTGSVTISGTYPLAP